MGPWCRTRADSESGCRAIGPMGSVTADVAPTSAETGVIVVPGSPTRDISSGPGSWSRASPGAHSLLRGGQSSLG